VALNEIREIKTNFPSQNESECLHCILQINKINKPQPNKWFPSNVEVKKWSNPSKDKNFTDKITQK
jgi:hypothetical protein